MNHRYLLCHDILPSGALSCFPVLQLAPAAFLRPSAGSGLHCTLRTTLKEKKHTTLFSAIKGERKPSTEKVVKTKYYN